LAKVIFKTCRKQPTDLAFVLWLFKPMQVSEFTSNTVVFYNKIRLFYSNMVVCY